MISAEERARELAGQVALHVMDDEPKRVFRSILEAIQSAERDTANATREDEAKRLEQRHPHWTPAEDRFANKLAASIRSRIIEGKP